MDEGFTTLEGKLSFMEREGISHSVLSLGNPWLDIASGEHSVSLASKINNELSALGNASNGHISTMGILPNHGVDSAIATVHNLSQSTHVGIATSTSICGFALDAPQLLPLWKEIATTRLPVLIHPVTGIGGDATRGYGQALTLSLSFPFETTAAVSRMVLAGTFKQFPDLRVIAAHGAGTIPYLAGRLRRAVTTDEAASASDLSLPPGLYADAILFSSSALKQCIEVFTSSGVLFGTDHPFPIASAEMMLRNVLEASTEPQVRDAILSKNAQQLFNLDL